MKTIISGMSDLQNPLEIMIDGKKHKGVIMKTVIKYKYGNSNNKIPW